MVSLIEDHPVLMEKSQLRSAKERKATALQEARSVILMNTGKKLDDKQILKKSPSPRKRLTKLQTAPPGSLTCLAYSTVTLGLDLTSHPKDN